MAKSTEEYIQDLCTLWSNFIHEDNAEKKEIWIQLFMFTYQFVDPDIIKSESFLKDVPPKVCSYMLKLVYEIISEAIETDFLKNEENGEENIVASKFDKNTFIAQLLEDKFKANESRSGLFQLCVGDPSDITAIISLRKFFTEGLGNHILDFLTVCDVKTITSRRNLVILLINSFPNSPWDNKNINYSVKDTLLLEEFINTFVIHKRQNIHIGEDLHLIKSMATKCASTTYFNAVENVSSSTNNEKIIPVSYDSVEFLKFKNKQKTSDEIAENLIELLGNFIREENGAILNENSATAECLKFAIATFCNIQHTNAFNEQNRSVLQLKLLSLIVLCLNNLFFSRANASLIDIKKMFEKFLFFLQSSYENKLTNDYEKIAIYEIIFLEFGLIHNMLICCPNKLNEIEDIIKMLNEDKIHMVYNFIKNLLHDSDIVNVECLKKFMDLLFSLMDITKMIELRRREQRIMKKKLKRKQIISKIRQIHCHQTNLPCLFEKIILKVLNILPGKIQEDIIIHLNKNGLCCCLYKSDILYMLFEGNYNNQMKKIIYNLIFNRILKTIFIKNGCEFCEMKVKSVDFHDKLFMFYKEKYLNIMVESSEIRIFLKHLLKISNLLTFDILSRILIDIVQPIFQNEFNKTKMERDTNIILECLHVFINYSNDSRLIEIFYSDEKNLRFLQEILYIPELSRFTCDLICVGIEKAPEFENVAKSGAGDAVAVADTDDDNDNNNCQERLLSKNLITFYLSAIEEITKKINKTFLILKRRTDMLITEETVFTKKSDDDDNDENLQCSYIDSMQITEVLYLASILWNFTFELYKTNEQFRTCFQMKYTVKVSNLRSNNKSSDAVQTSSDIDANYCAIFQLVHDTLTAYLYKSPEYELSRYIFTSTSNNSSSDTFSDSSFIIAPYSEGNRNISSVTLRRRQNGGMTDDIQVDPIKPRSITVNDIISDNSSEKYSTENINASTACNFYGEKRDNIFTDDISVHSSFMEIISKSYLDDDSSVQSEFLEKLKSCNDTNIIFDIKNQSNNGSYYNLNHNEENNQDDLLTSGLRTINWIISSSYTLLFGSSGENINNYKNKLPEHQGSNNEEIYHRENEKLQELRSNKCKNSLIKIFEYTFAVFIMENSQTKDQMLSQCLKKLKNVILAHSKEATDNSNTSAIIQTLQSLLKVAELAQRPNSLSRNKQPSITIPQKESGGEESAINTSLDSDADYHSSKLSCSQLDSETEFSENETEDYYITADEGYQADVELPEISEIDDESPQDVWCPYLPSSRYRALIAHEGICKMIIEILITLSIKCLENPSEWSGSLAQLTNRLYMVRESLGGSLFLLKGFAPILKDNNPKLRDLQQSILELLIELDSPESFCAYLEIIGSDKCPIDILIRYMNIICLTNIKTEPSAELVFPVANDDFESTTCNPILFEQIRQLRNYHLYHHLETPFTLAPCIIPLVHNKLWHEGFTVSTWFRIKLCSLPKTSESNNGEISENNFKKIHLISMGSNQILLSAYINEELSLTFETSKPNQEIDQSKDGKINSTSKTTKECGSHSQSGSTVKQQIKKLNKPTELPELDTNKENIASNSKLLTSPKDKVTNAFQCTKLAILKGISHFQLFPSSSRSAGDTFEKSTVDLKNFHFPRKKWIHLCFAIDPQPNSLRITMMLDGTEQHVISLPCNTRQLGNSDNFQVICLGHCDKSTGIDSFLEYSMSNLMLFHKSITDRSILANLTALGPDCTNLTYCQVGNNVPNYGLLNFSQIFNLEIGNFGESIRYLKECLIASYTAHEPGHIISYEKDTDGSTLGCINGLIMFGGKLVTHAISSIQTTVFLSGGLPCLLLVFAKAVEVTSDSTIQALALDILLSIARSNSNLYTEFVRKRYLNLIGYVIRAERCTKDISLLKSIINNACTQSVICKRNDLIHIMENTTASVIHPNFIVTLLRRYSDWYRQGSKESIILDTILQCIRALVREKHPYRIFNIRQLMHAGLIRELLNLCKVYIIESPFPVHISEETAKLFVCILNTFAGSPPSPSFLDEIMKLLLLLQRPSECFITHDRSKFYFLVSSDPPIKHKKVSLPLPSKQMKQIMRERKKTAPANLQNVEYGQSISVDKPFETHVIKKDLKSRKNTNKSKGMKIGNILYVENFNDLKKIADCSRINESAFKSLTNKSKHYKHRYFLFNKNKTGLHGVPLQKDKIGKIFRKRGRNSLKSNVDNEIEKNRKFLINTDGDNDFIAAAGEYDIIDSDELSDLENPKHLKIRKYKFLSKRDFYALPGIIKLQKGLFDLLNNFLLILPDTSIEEVLTHYIKIEILLVLSNHKSPEIRASIVKLISTLCDRLPTIELVTFGKKFYWHHLANQISLNPVNGNLLEACMQWITGSYLSLDEYLSNENLIVTRKYALNSLIAILPQTLSNNVSVLENAFKIVKKIFVEDISSCHYFLENGITQSTVKTLYRLYMKLKPISNFVEKSITDLLYAIAEKSSKSIGQINILWELFNLLSVHQDSDILSVARGFRSMQSNILLHTLYMFSRLKSNENLQLSSSESKTRLELLIDRSLQLLFSIRSSYKPTSSEVKLLEFLLLLNVSGNKIDNFVIWGLLPSRSSEIRNFVINSLWNVYKINTLHHIFSDIKIKSLLTFHLSEEDRRDSNQNSNIYKLCAKLHITKRVIKIKIDSDKFDLNKERSLLKQKGAVEKALYKFESLAQSCIESSMIVTRIVTELQNSERKVLMSQMKEYDENYIYSEWVSVIQRMTYEGAPWYNERNYPKSWELDDTEGPSRVRVRLRRCHLNLEPRFIMTELQEQDVKNMQPFEYLLAGHDNYLSFSKNSQILYNFPALYLPVDGEIEGELLITDEKIYFVATYHYRFYCLTYDIKSITEIWLRRYQHQEKAFEIFLDSNKSKFFALQSMDDFKAMKEIFADKIVQFPDQSKLLLITQQWRDGQLTNWDYIMALNQISGRTYNDLMQYPVFPWVLSNFDSEYLNLKDSKNFRHLEKPIAVQHKENEMHYIENYKYISDTMTNMGTLLIKPYHYSSHYSNSGTVLHFLVRVPPFTGYFLRYQDNNFDLPDRTFHSLNTTWCLASRDSPTDVKELIPEFFCLPEMFENFEGFNFGARQSGEVVDNVILPPWCLNNPRLFIFIHRQALETENVRNNLHNWIDLIFGYKQNGMHAVEAINVFHPATYAEFNVSKILDPIERKAVETMVKTYGQMPKQLLRIPHPASKQFPFNDSMKNVLPTVEGLRWGVFTGSPELSEPELFSRQMSGAQFSSLVSFSQTNVVYGLPEKCCVMQGAEADIYLLVSWNHEDRLVRFQSLSETNSRSKPLLYNNPLDEITCSGSDFNSNSLWFGHKSGRISVYQCYKSHKYNKSRHTQSNIKLSYNSAFRMIPSKQPQKAEEQEDDKDVNGVYETGDLRWLPAIILTRHSDKVTSIVLSAEFKIAVSAGRDGLAVIWDSNNFCYIRAIQKPTEMQNLPINLIAVSPTLGDIITVHSLEKFSKNGINDNECFEVTEDNFDGFVNVSMNLSGKSMMRLHSINAKYIQRIISPERIVSVCYSYVKEGIGVNVIATGLETGVVKFWSSWNLAYIKEIDLKSDILSLTYSTYQHLIVLTGTSYIEVWRSEGLYGKPPMFPQIAFNKINLN